MTRRDAATPRWALASLFGLGLAATVAQLPGTWPALAIAAGVPAVVAGVFLLGGDRKYYSAAGSAYCVLLGALWYVGVAPAVDDRGPAVPLLALGIPSALVVAAIYAGEWLLERRVGDGEGAVAAVASRALTAVTAFRLARSAFAIGRIAVYAVVVVLVGAATFALGGLGVEAPIPVPGRGRVDAVLLAFVAAVLVGFHGLAAAHATWLAARDLAETGREAKRQVERRRSSTERDPPDADE